MIEEVMCHKCGKYEAEQCFTICEFCMEISDEKEYLYKQLKAYKDKEDKFGEKKYTLEELQYVYEDATRNKILEDMVNLNNQLELCLNKIKDLEQKHGIEVE